MAPHPFGRGTTSQCGSQAQGGRDPPLWEKSLWENLEWRKAVSACLWGVWEWGQSLGRALRGNGTLQRCPGTDMPLRSLGWGAGGISARRGGTWGPPTPGNPTRSLRGRQGRPRWGPRLPSMKGSRGHSRRRGRFRAAGSAAGAALRTPPSNAGSARTCQVERSVGGVWVGGWGGAGHRKGSSRPHCPHSTCLTPLTSPAHPAEVLPPARARGPGLPCRCRPRSRRNCSLEDRQHRPRCRCRRPRWKSSHTWGQGGRHPLSLPGGLILGSCEVGVAVPILRVGKRRPSKTTLRVRGQSQDSNPGLRPCRCGHGEGKSAHSPLRTPTNCRLLGPGLGWAPGVASLLFMMDLRVPGGVR